MVRQIDPDLVMKLREEVPEKKRMECKKALIESDGDIEEAKKKLSGTSPSQSKPEPKSKSKKSKKDEEPEPIEDTKEEPEEEDNTNKDDKK